MKRHEDIDLIPSQGLVEKKKILTEKKIEPKPAQKDDQFSIEVSKLAEPDLEAPKKQVVAEAKKAEPKP